jgi:hypothetical protein
VPLFDICFGKQLGVVELEALSFAFDGLEFGLQVVDHLFIFFILDNF